MSLHDLPSTCYSMAKVDASSHYLVVGVPGTTLDRLEKLVYQLTGNEQKEESTEKVECGEVITTKYFNGDKLVRVDKTVNVDAAFMVQAFQGMVK